ncbi:hypothetical protein [Corynebacterium ulcerans]|uniref:hypothetical protein n=1 Tax=Corynebacterium ulcerans TaxID=65058 RepID=UPI001F52BD5A|nr:hypothetical protein [Corynebacterium ulcerans]
MSLKLIVQIWQKWENKTDRIKERLFLGVEQWEFSHPPFVKLVDDDGGVTR